MNVLLVTVDCLRRDRCGIYGHHRDTTPTLDALARDGFVFDNAFATGPVTTESFPGILAGRLSAQTVAGDNLYQKCIPEGEPTIASHLRDAGYDTVGVISNPRIGSHVNTDCGFETFVNLRTGDESGDEGNNPESLLPDLQVGERLYQLRETMREHDSVPCRYELPFLAFRTYQYLSGWPSVRGEQVVDRFLDELLGTSSPFFGWTHLMDVHGPIHPQTVTDGGLSSGGPFSQFRSHAKRVSNVHDAQTEVRYDSAVRYVDDQIRRIVDWLKEADLWDETALIVTADHGDALYDRDIYGHPQHYMYDELLAAPLVVRVPGYEGERIKHSFSLGWLHEIVTEFGDVGEFEPPLSSSKGSHFSMEIPDEQEVLLADSISRRGHSVVARKGEIKYVIQTEELSTGDEIEVGPHGCYRLDMDPEERVPHHSQNINIEQAARQVIIKPEDFREQGGSKGINDRTLDRLKQLGYAEE